MELKQAVNDYLKAKGNLESILGKSSVITNRFDGTVSLIAEKINCLVNADEVNISRGPINFPWLVSGSICGVAISCVSYKKEIEEAGLMK